MNNILNGIILRASYPSNAPTPETEVLGKALVDWVALSFDNNPVIKIDYSESLPIPPQIREFLNPDLPYTVVLYSDTPLITKQTVFDAVTELERSGKNVLKLTRGYVFKTHYVLGAEKIYTSETHYFESDDFVTACSFKQLGLISELLKGRILDYHMQRGVHFEDISSTFVDSDVTLGENVRISPNNILRGKTIIRANARLLSGNTIENSIIDEGATINSSQIYKSYIGKGTTVGPFAYIRPDTHIGDNCRIGDFVEIKKSIIGNGSKISHLSYVGDCRMGENCNVGCGVVFVNYDGRDKFKSFVGDRVFIGSNSNIIAPVTLGDNSFVAAGSTVTDDVDSGALAIARARQIVKPDWKGNKFTKE